MFTKIDILAAPKCSFVVPWGYGIVGEWSIGGFFFSAFMHLRRLLINKKVNYKLNYECQKSLQIIHISRFILMIDYGVKEYLLNLVGAFFEQQELTVHQILVCKV